MVTGGYRDVGADYELLRDAIIEHLGGDVQDDDIAEVEILVAAVERAGKRLKELELAANPVAQTVAAMERTPDVIHTATFGSSTDRPHIWSAFGLHPNLDEELAEQDEMADKVIEKLPDNTISLGEALARLHPIEGIRIGPERLTPDAFLALPHEMLPLDSPTLLLLSPDARPAPDWPVRAGLMVAYFPHEPRPGTWGRLVFRLYYDVEKQKSRSAPSAPFIVS